MSRGGFQVQSTWDETEAETVTFASEPLLTIIMN